MKSEIRNPKSAIRILLADDHAVVRRGLKQILSEGLPGVSFGEVTSADEVLENVWRANWDIVILDISMPGRSGLEALRDIRRERPEVPVLILSIHSEDQYAVRVLKAGAAGYMTKECAPDELVAAVKRVVRGGKYVSPSLAEKLAVDVVVSDQGPPHGRLSDREYEVMLHLAAGKKVKDIAAMLSLAKQTISTHRAKILDKMQMQSDTDLTQYAVREKLLE